jgi:hypothetical protein
MADPTPEELAAVAAQKAADAAAATAKAVQAEEAKKHVRMTHKESGGKLNVHPTTVAAHQAVGWVVAK